MKENLSDDVTLSTVLRGRLVMKSEDKVIERNFSLINSKSQVGISILKGVFRKSGKEFAQQLSEGVHSFKEKINIEKTPIHTFKSE